MKNKALKHIFCCLLVLLVLAGTIPISAQTERDAVKEAKSLIDGIAVQNTGVGAEWYVIAMRQYGQQDFSAYEEALLNYLQETQVQSASTRQKYALTLLAIDSTNEYIQNTVNDSIGQQGIMSWVFGLHLLNNGCTSQTHTKAQVKDTILSLQLDDGGWAVMGKNSDVDVTAMAVQALAPSYGTDDAVTNAIDKALTLLSQRQLEDGDYASYGVTNAESTAQVMIALSALGIDCETDSRFLKNGNTLFDGVEKYQLADGSFCHQIGGESNETATMQVLCAMVSYVRMAEGKSGLYLFDSETSAETPAATAETPTPGYKPWACLVILGIGGVVCLLLLLCKKWHIKNLLAVLLVVALGIGFVLVTDFQTAQDYYGSTPTSKENSIGTVTLTIRCDTVAGKSDSAYIPADGIILETTEFAIAEGDTVFDILTEAARKYDIQLEYNGTETMAYIVGIEYLYEFAFGDLSGWVYHVNDASPSVGCGEYVLKDGDAVAWLYSCDLGNDVKKKE